MLRRISKRDLSEEEETHNILESIDAASQQYENNREPKSDNTGIFHYLIPIVENAISA